MCDNHFHQTVHQPGMVADPEMQTQIHEFAFCGQVFVSSELLKSANGL